MSTVGKEFTVLSKEELRTRSNAEALGFETSPYEYLNRLPDLEKQSLTRYLAETFKQFILHGGDVIPLADSRFYYENGLPRADRTLFRGPRNDITCQCDTLEESLQDKTEIEDELDFRMVHEKLCWPSKMQVLSPCRGLLYMDGTNRIDLRHDAYVLRSHFTERWAVPKDDCTDYRPHRNCQTSWADNELCTTESTGISLRADHPDGEYTSLSDLITSQLLLYRLVCTFGIPPNTRLDGYKCCWSYILLNLDDPTCSLVINDFKGAPRAAFGGGLKANTEALQLLEFLIGDKCMHLYNYTPCGRVA